MGGKEVWSTIKLALLLENMTQQEYSKKHYQMRKSNGLCPRCGNKLDRIGHYCEECKEKVRIYNRETRAFYKSIGICPQCRKEKLFGDEKSCIECRQKNYERESTITDKQMKIYRENFKEKQKILYKERSEKGICTRCGKLKVVPGRKKCGLCLEKDRLSHTKYYEKRA